MRPGELNKAIIDSNSTHLLVFIPNVETDDKHLKKIKKMLKHGSVESSSRTKSTDKPWFKNPETVVKLQNMFQSFTEFALVPKNPECIVAHYKEYQGVESFHDVSGYDFVAIHVCADGKKSSFIAPSKLENVAVDQAEDGISVKLMWEEPYVGKEHVKQYVITYFEKNQSVKYIDREPTDLEATFTVSSSDTGVDTNGLPILKPNKEYTFTVRTRVKCPIHENESLGLSKISKEVKLTTK